MSDIVECPYCSHRQDYITEKNLNDGDHIEVECDKCEMNYITFFYLSYYYTDSQKAPCLNGENHRFKKVFHIPRLIFGKVTIRCEDCFFERRIPWKEAAPYGFEMEELEKESQKENNKD